MLMRLIEDFCSDETIAEIDWGYGSATYKDELGTAKSTRSNAYYFAPTAYGQLLRTVRLAVVGSHRALKHILERYKLLDRIRTGWRQLGGNSGKATGKPAASKQQILKT